MTTRITYEYESVTGKVETIEIDQHWAEVLKELDTTEKRNDRRESRRHVSIGFDGSWYADEMLDPAAIIESKETLEEMKACLNPAQRELFQLIYINGYSQSECAEIYGVTRGAICQRMRTIRKKLEQFLD